MENSVKLEMSFTFSRQRKIWSSRLAILKRMQKNCTEIYNTRAKPLLCSLNLLLGDVPVAAAVVVFLKIPYLRVQVSVHVFAQNRRCYLCILGTVHIM